jgi:hypothetical protein
VNGDRTRLLFTEENSHELVETVKDSQGAFSREDKTRGGQWGVPIERRLDRPGAPKMGWACSGSDEWIDGRYRPHRAEHTHLRGPRFVEAEFFFFFNPSRKTSVHTRQTNRQPNSPPRRKAIIDGPGGASGVTAVSESIPSSSRIHVWWRKWGK